MFSKACEYGIRATLFIAKKSLKGERVSLKEIAREIDSPEAFTGKILQKISRKGIIQSIKGPMGGFEIEKQKMRDTKLSLLVETIDGNEIYTACGLGLKACNAQKPCPVHHKFAIVRRELRHMLEGTSLHELAINLNEEQSYLSRI